jgi:ribose 5-phosphate isomerase B
MAPVKKTVKKSSVKQSSVQQSRSVHKPLVVIGSDHAGYKTKQAVMKALAKSGYTLLDVGTFNPDTRVDYPVYAEMVAKAVAHDPHCKGILVCGTGTGMAIAANKHKGIRAAFAFDTYSAKMAREHNDANILALRGRQFPTKTDIRLAKTFLASTFSGDARHKRRIALIAKLER